MSFTITLIIITVALSVYAQNTPGIKSQWMMNPYQAYHRKQYYRFITSGFIHDDWMHLGFNMFTMMFFGQVIETTYMMYFGIQTGQFLFLVLYIGGIVVSDIPNFLRYKDAPAYNTLGASGGVSSVIFACILFNPLANICLYALLCLPGFILGTFYIIYSATLARGSHDNVNHNAHLYGALFGLAFSIAILPQVVPHFFQQLANWKGFF